MPKLTEAEQIAWLKSQIEHLKDTNERLHDRDIIQEKLIESLRDENKLLQQQIKRLEEL